MLVLEPSMNPREIANNNGKKTLIFFDIDNLSLFNIIPEIIFPGYIKYNEYLIINGMTDILHIYQ